MTNNNKSNYTKYFDSCKGVFQGGGCKAIVYIGAYKEAYNRGVFFSELAGTSAGSVIAALIAAGATPDYLESKIKSISFSDFVQGNANPKWYQKLILKRIIPKEYHKLINNVNISSLQKEWGLFNVKYLESFVENCLKELTNIKTTVCFKDLTPNLHIVCSDLETHKTKIWNKTNTPNDSVAKAVSTSCCIPLFFRPVDKRYVDGGILSNLPKFIFSEEPHYNRILCFRNQSSQPQNKITNVYGYLISIIDTITEGAEGIQQYLDKESYDVPITVDEVTAIDFNKIDEQMIDLLVKKGEDSMRSFLDDETTFLNYNKVDSRSLLDKEERAQSMVSYISMEKHKEICVSADDTYWSWNLFLSIVKWINDGTKVYVYVPKEIREKYAAEEKARRRMINAMGCSLIECDRISVKGFFFLKRNMWYGIAYTKEDDVFWGKYYNSPIDSPLIKEWVLKYKNLNAVEDNGSKKTKRDITMKPLKEKVVLSLLRNESTYADAKLSFETMELNKLLFLNPYIRALKYKQIGTMFEMYNDIDIFGPACFIFPNGKQSVIGPPLVEEHNGKFYVIEGNTRCLYAYKHGISKLRMVVARQVGSPLPCEASDTYEIQKVLISDLKLKGDKRYKGFNYENFRHIEKSIRPYEDYLK